MEKIKKSFFQILQDTETRRKIFYENNKELYLLLNDLSEIDFYSKKYQKKKGLCNKLGKITMSIEIFILYTLKKLSIKPIDPSKNIVLFVYILEVFFIMVLMFFYSFYVFFGFDNRGN